MIFENRIAGSMLSAFVGAISGPSVARGVSFLKDKLGQRLFPQGFELVDDPFRLRGLGSSPFDDEGVAVQRRLLVDDGVVDDLAAQLLGRPPARPDLDGPRHARPRRPARRRAAQPARHAGRD